MNKDVFLRQTNLEPYVGQDKSCTRGLNERVKFSKGAYR